MDAQKTRAVHNDVRRQIMFSAPDMVCPHCDGRIDAKPFSLGAWIGAMVLGDIATFTLVGVFVLVGLMWEPAWVIAFVIVVVGFVRRSSKQMPYACTKCHAEFTLKQLYATKP
ncbi:MAG: hypothetical protein ABL891_17600 [Burkholderiales bacterium]